MEVVIFFGVVFFITYIFSKKDDNNTSSNATYSGTQNKVNKSNTTYRPKKTPKNKISFPSANNVNVNNTNSEDLTDLHDAFTGAPLNASLGLYKCNKCQVYYHTESYQILKDENSGQCMACSSTDIIATNKVKEGARNANPNTITLTNYKQYVGQVIEFEANVTSVKESKRGNDFAVMFENKSWVRGFKMVFFRGSIAKCGGKRYIKNLNGKTIKVRGLLVNHSRFGYEIIISDPKQIMKAL